MKLKNFMDDAYQGKTRSRHLDTKEGEAILGLEDLVERLSPKPTKADVERLVPSDPILLKRLLALNPAKNQVVIWGYLTSIAAERSAEPLKLSEGSFVGIGLSRGTIVLEEGRDHIGEGISGGRIVIKGKVGDYLGQDMSGGGIVAGSCGDYAFNRMKGGFGVVLGDAGDFLGLGNLGGRVAVKGGCGSRAGWLMKDGKLRIRGDAGEYLGLLMKGGEIRVKGKSGPRAGWRMKGGSIWAADFGPESGDGADGGSIHLEDR